MVRAVVADVAEEELAVVDGLCAFDDDTVVRRLSGRGRRRERLGFGWDEIVTVATPVVWLAVNQAARQIGTAAGKGAATGTKAVLRKVFRRGKAARTLPPLTPQQLADIREQVFQTALKRGLQKKRAEELSDAVYTQLSLSALANPAPSTSDDSTQS
ncbi:hypothetical protein [Kutzneria sp. CA-103260]|uniref:hypothetical protein n=1 Tax=Kutzneria sp. CA-103260 TaxID=2802641 RepID=UPI001BA8A840|nr:hypothetical protein [Kutzneria sp. CA-103260]QUQ64512.1 hypothetical protein JJ691_22320 [Kutzneria sp. CA-103260]